MMPRTSPFKGLSSAILAATVGKDLQIEESVIKRGLATRQPREIEIVIRHCTGENLFLAECRAYNRAQDTLWIEQLDDKRLTLGFERVFAISRSGFTKAAQVLAAARRIEIARLTKAEAADWTLMFDSDQSI